MDQPDPKHGEEEFQRPEQTLDGRSTRPSVQGDVGDPAAEIKQGATAEKLAADPNSAMLKDPAGGVTVGGKQSEEKEADVTSQVSQED